MVSYFTNNSSGEVTNFHTEISNMMHGFGDNPYPNAATVVLIESIVHQQLRWMLQEALNYAKEQEISNYHIIFLLRKNKLKMKRLHDYQLKLDLIGGLKEPMKFIPPEIILKKVSAAKKRRTHIDIIQELDVTGEVSQIKFDSIDYLRKVRASKITESMAFDKYEAYHKARCSSFRTGYGSGKGFVKFEKWLNPKKEIKISVSALEVLCFLAYETVAEIVDAVFLIRQDACKQNGDPFSKFEGGNFCNPVSLNNAEYMKSGYESVPAITVAEVREVLRRYFNPTVGMNGLFYRNMNLELPIRYIAF